MRLVPVLALAILLASGCASPCENVNANQTDAAMQTCAFSASLQADGTGSFSPDDGAPVAFTVSPSEPLADAFPDGSAIRNGMWAAQGESLPTVPDSSRQISSSTIAPEAGRYALATRWDGMVRVYASDGQPLAAVRVAEGEDARAAAMGIAGWPNNGTHLLFSRDGSTLFGADTQGNLTAWNATSGEPLWDATVALDDGREDGGARTPASIRSLALSPDGGLIAAASARGVDVLNATSGESVARWEFPKGKTSVIRVSFAPDGQHVAVTKSGRYIPASTRYTSFDENGQRTDVPEMQQTEARQNTPTVFLLTLP